MMRILLFTYSEHGQANTILALAEELARRQSVQQVNVCSYPDLRKRVEAIHARSSSPVIFHPLEGPNFEGLMKLNGLTFDDLRHPPSSKSIEGFRTLDRMVHLHDDEAYRKVVEASMTLIKSLDPDIIILDMVSDFAVDACRLLDRRYIVNTPLQSMDILRMLQPWGKALWYYPAVFSGNPFPVPWRLFFSNIVINIKMIATFMSNPLMNASPASRKKNGYKGGHPLREYFHPDINFISPSIVETDFPHFCPPNIRRFGTITLDTVPLEQSDPELHAWLDRKRTVVIVLGTHINYSENTATAFICGLLEYLPTDMQVLWKLKNKSEVGHIVEGFMDKAEVEDRNRFKIVDWIVGDPSAIMVHPNVACYVHHGGANSFHECCLAGVPQLILAMWLDLYDTASKVEYRGLGIYGNKSCAPGVDAVEFGKALARITTSGPEADQIKANTTRVAKLCKEAGGKKAAVDFILSTLDRGKTWVYPS
ncbi:hypothetical protein HGRIS_008444 [Hohenbuehelia grisea]|uniref:UDP-glucoronosyl and UDP-glucosyl transferase family protein n=1 Tax=Hohenbuehelia grisea TaxID=104357 RepID=A0ABR3J8H3_9AGAR